jgi:hypothetical protein
MITHLNSEEGKAEVYHTNALDATQYQHYALYACDKAYTNSRLGVSNNSRDMPRSGHVFDIGCIIRNSCSEWARVSGNLEKPDTNLIFANNFCVMIVICIRLSI